jgi:uncharacterized protein (TIGR02594 family)
MNEPEWMAYARQFLGLKEIPGTTHNPTIVDWLVQLRAWWRDDETPWCGVFCAHVMSHSQIVLPQHWYRARDWLNWGESLGSPTPGCIVVFSRQKGGHVGFVVGQDIDGHLMVLGGNQGNRVSVMPFDRQRVLGFRWPSGKVLAIRPLPFVDYSGQLSTNEA